jgi:hypothetical protein
LKFFIASHSQIEAKKLRDQLVKAGHEVTSRWIIEDTKFHMSLNAYTDEERTHIAQLDEEDVRKAEDGVILIAEKKGRCVPGGKHVETGIALGLGRPIYVIGRKENIFHWHPKVTIFKDVNEFLAYIVA